MKLDINQSRLMNFLMNHPEKWNTYHNDYNTVRLVESLVKKGLVKINKSNQMKLVSNYQAVLNS